MQSDPESAALRNCFSLNQISSIIYERSSGVILQISLLQFLNKSDDLLKYVLPRKYSELNETSAPMR